MTDLAMGQTGHRSEKLAPKLARQIETPGLLLRRWFGCWVDFIALAVIVVGPIVLAGVLHLEALADPITIAALLAGLAYFPVTEFVWQRSLGKLVTGLIVVNELGGRPNIGQVIVRTLLRLIEVNPFLAGGIPAGLTVMFTQTKQRLGDLVANTYVLPADKVREGRDMTGAETVF